MTITDKQTIHNRQGFQAIDNEQSTSLTRGSRMHIKQEDNHLWQVRL